MAAQDFFGFFTSVRSEPGRGGSLFFFLRCTQSLGEQGINSFFVVNQFHFFKKTESLICMGL
jgi:hypothetical protein